MSGWLPARSGIPGAAAIPPPPPAPPSGVPERASTTVRLEFRDGTVIDLGPNNAAAIALQQAAANLLAGLRARATR